MNCEIEVEEIEPKRLSKGDVAADVTFRIISPLGDIRMKVMIGKAQSLDDAVRRALHEVQLFATGLGAAAKKLADSQE